MKKYYFIAVALFMAAMVSCGAQKGAEEVATNDSVNVELVDSTAEVVVDTVVAE